MGQALDSLSERLSKLEAVVAVVQEGQAKLLTRIEQIEDRLKAQASRGPACMPGWLRQWWEEAIGRLKLAVKSADFLEATVQWFGKQG